MRKNTKGDRKKLSWTYRKKIKAQKAKRITQNVSNNAGSNDKPRIIVRNVSFKATKEDVKQLYEPFGEILEINFPKRADGTPIGCCFIQFKKLEDASKAIFNTNKKEFLGRVISSSWAIEKSKYCEKEDIKPSNVKSFDATNEDITHKKEEETNQNKKHKNENITVDKEKIEKLDDPSKQEIRLQKTEARKLLKEKNRKKRARIVVRNLPFQITEAYLKEHFSQYGEIEDMTILKRSNGQTVGCAFLQYKHVQSAAKAIHYANLQPLQDRPVIVDWAVPKMKFSQTNSLDINTNEVKIKLEKEDDFNTDKVLTSNEEVGGDDEKPHPDNKFGDSDSDRVEEIVLNEKDESDDEEMETLECKKRDDLNEVEIKEDIKDVQRPRFESHDVSEGKTVFLKNVPFSIKNEELRMYMEKFGPVYYALVCIDPLTEYSKGTAFVKFRNAEDAQKCLSVAGELQIDDQIIEVHKALDKKELASKTDSKQQRKKDSRNLYLVKEGVIFAGSAAAAGVSAADMAKRLQVEQWKSQILRNLNMFVSRTRLVIHNLPSTLDDAKLRQICERHSASSAVIKEVRIMRDLKNVDLKGVGRSKEYAFVSFTKHEDALHLLRAINNNPNIFTPKRRPIVSFSIENRVLVNAKQKRLEKSRENNPLWAGNKVKRRGEDAEEEIPAKNLKMTRTEDPNTKSYVGSVAKVGENKLRSKHNIKTQAMVHSRTLKKEKKIQKSNKKEEIKRRKRVASNKEVKSARRTKVIADDVNLDKLVNRYKDKLKSIELKRSKWYES